MATNFPTLLDTFTNPLATSLQTAPSHSQQHSDINDAVEALEAKVGIGATVLGTYTAYTPTFTSGLTVGDGTFSSAYARVNNLTHYYGTFTFGSTSSITAATVTISLPTTAHSSITGLGFPGFNSSVVNFYDVSGFLSVYGFAAVNSATAARIYASIASGTYPQLATLSSTIPFTWAAGDVIQWDFTYRTA